MIKRRSIDLTAARKFKPPVYRFAKITTESTELAEPYTSTGDIYCGRWLDDSTERTADVTDANIISSFFTTDGMWVLVLHTPLGHWEAVAEYQQD
jgi:hypothetical protein